MAIRGTVIVKFRRKKELRRTQAAVTKAYKVVAKEMEAEMQRKSRAKQSPPASTAGQFPSKDTGRFASGINVTGTAKGITVASQELYGKFLETGTRRMAARPWAKRIVSNPKWQKRVADLARKFSGGRLKPKKIR